MDATVANLPGLLPGRNDDHPTVMATMARMSFSQREAVAVIGAGHTIASVSACLCAHFGGQGCWGF